MGHTEQVSKTKSSQKPLDFGFYVMFSIHLNININFQDQTSKPTVSNMISILKAYK